MLNFTKKQIERMTAIIRENDDYGANMTDEQIIETAHQLTAYEKYGSVNISDLQAYAASEFISDMDIYAYNRWCEENRYYDDMVYPMDEIDELLQGVQPWDILRAGFYGDFKPYDDYFGFNGYGNLVSYSEYEIEKTNRIIDQFELKTYFMENEIYDVFSSEEQDILQALSDNQNSIIACANYLISEGF